MSLVREIIEKRAIPGVVEGMKIIRLGQREGTDGIEVKENTNQTLKTVTDDKVEGVLSRHLSGIPGTRFKGEEGSESGNGIISITADPLDGTGIYAAGGSTSTIIVEVSDPVLGCIGALVAEPSTGRIWTAIENEPTQLRLVNDQGGLNNPKTVKVWKGDGELSRALSIVYVDINSQFIRFDRLIMDNDQVKNLILGVVQSFKLLMLGSNGVHYAYVANGSENEVGGITTAADPKGGYDMAGVKLIKNAGGVAAGFRVEKDSNEQRYLVRVNPLMLLECDMMVYANCQQALDKLIEILFRAFWYSKV